MPSYDSLNLRPADREAYAAAAAGLDMDAVRQTATALVRLVLTDDYSYIDALPDEVQDELLTPLGMLSEALRDQVDSPILIAAIRAVRLSAQPVLSQCPQEMRESIQELP